MLSTTRIAIAALGLVAAAAAQTTVTIPCSLDNSLYEDATGSLSNAKGIGLFVGVTGQNTKRRALVKFDIAGALPAGARVLDASLNITVTRTAVPFDVDVFAHRALASWGEGTSNAPGQEGGGAPSSNGDATWRHRFYPNTLWTNLGGDFAPTASAVVRSPAYGSASSGASSAFVQDVQQMLSNPASNHGWLLKTNEAQAYVARRLGSRESTTPPSLTVTYLLPGQTALWGTGCPVNGQNFLHAVGGAPIGGTTVQLQQLLGPANSPAVNLLALDLDGPGNPLLPQCNLHLPLTGPIVSHNILVLDGSGFGSSPLPIPVGFGGVFLVSQTAALTPSGGFVLSNAAAMLLQ
jgi:hypothetical protein